MVYNPPHMQPSLTISLVILFFASSSFKSSSSLFLSGEQTNSWLNKLKARSLGLAPRYTQPPLTLPPPHLSLPPPPSPLPLSPSSLFPPGLARRYASTRLLTMWFLLILSTLLRHCRSEGREGGREGEEKVREERVKEGRVREERMREGSVRRG